MPMKRPATQLERLVGENLTSLMASNESLKVEEAVAKATRNHPGKVSQTTVGRIKKAHHSAQLDTIEALAHAFGIPAWHLLFPKLDPKNPPTVISGSEGRLYVRFRETVNEFSQAAESDPEGPGATDGGLPNSPRQGDKRGRTGGIQTKTAAKKKAGSTRREHRKAVTLKANK